MANLWVPPKNTLGHLSLTLYPIHVSSVLRWYSKKSLRLIICVFLTLSFLKISFITLVIFCNFLDEDKWKTEARTEGGAIQEYTISYQNLVPSTIYNFRVIAYNKYGISSPLEEKSSVSPRICIPYIYDTAVIFFFKKVVRWLCKYPNTI